MTTARRHGEADQTGSAAEESGGFHPGFNPWAIAFTVTMATFMEVLDTSIANVALPHIAGGLSATQEEATWVLTSYLVSNAIVLPISGWIATRMGRKRFYMTCVALFTVSSFMCGIAPSLGTLIFFRILQGLGGGGLAPSEQAILSDTFEPKKRGMAFALYGMAVVLAPAIGPTLGGFITDHMSWRWIFFLNVPVGITSLMLTSRIVSDPPWLTEEKNKKNPIDGIGLGLVALGLGSLEVVLDKGQEDDWFGSMFITTFAITAVVAIVAFVVWECFEEHPVVDMKLFKNRNFAVTTGLIFLLGFVLYGTTVLIPQFVQLFMGYTATEAGMTLSPGAASIILFMPVIGVLVGRVQARYLIAIGFTIESFALYRMTNIDLQIDFRTAVFWRIWQAAGLAFLFIPITTAAYVGVPKEKNNDVSGMLNLGRNVGGSVGISFVSTVLARHSQAHQNFLVQHLTPFDAPYRAMVREASSALVNRGVATGAAMHAAQGRVWGELLRQSQALAYRDLLWVMTFAAIAIVPFVFLLRKNDPREGSPAAA
ncbi:MAG: DHA2 family efflux MFS transporter permease subunit [Polyangiaceae bacterium]